jgi:hypothetical protein
MVSSRRCLMECGSSRFAFFGVTFAGVAAVPSLAICAAAREIVDEEEVCGRRSGAGEWKMRDAGPAGI